MFVGRSSHKLNKDGRLSIPAKMRDLIEKKYDPEELYLVLMPGNVLCLYPSEEFKDLTARFSNPQGAPLSEIMEMERVCANAELCKVDGSGRVVIPPEMKQNAKIIQDVLVIGAMSHIEIWDPTRWDWHQEQSKSGMDKLMVGPAQSNNNSKVA